MNYHGILERTKTELAGYGLWCVVPSEHSLFYQLLILIFLLESLDIFFPCNLKSVTFLKLGIFLLLRYYINNLKN